MVHIVEELSIVSPDRWNPGLAALGHIALLAAALLVAFAAGFAVGRAILRRVQRAGAGGVQPVLVHLLVSPGGQVVEVTRTGAGLVAQRWEETLAGWTPAPVYTVELLVAEARQHGC